MVDRATGPQNAIRISEPELVPKAPELIRDSDWVSVFRPHGSDRFTSSEVLVAEDELVSAARSTDGPCIDSVTLDSGLAIHQARTGLVLDEGQRSLVEAFACSPARIVVGIGHAGAGKTTAMRAFATTWQTGAGSAGHGRASGGRVVPLATSSKAAHVLGEELEMRAENLHKFLHENHRPERLQPGGPADPWFQLRRGDVVLVDEAGMAGTLHLHQLLRIATDAGATVRLLGDPAQLAAVDAKAADELWAQLSDWVGWLRSRYPLAKKIPPCWSQHPEVVEELTALWLAWQGAYTDLNAPKTAAVEWHDHWLPGLLHRLEHGPLGIDCFEGHHAPSSRSYAALGPPAEDVASRSAISGF